MNLKIKRLIAIFIDYMIIFFILYIPSSIIQKTFNNIIVDIICGIVDAILIVVLFLKKDCLIGYESIGKKIMGLKIYQNGERIKDKKILVDRITKTFYSFPFYPFMILINNKSSGDKKLNTEVK